MNEEKREIRREDIAPEGSLESQSQQLNLGLRLQALRKFLGISQRELARRANMTNSTLSMIEQGKVSPSVASLEKILKVIPISLEEFFSGQFRLSSEIIRSQDFERLQLDGAEIHQVMIQGYAGLGDPTLRRCTVEAGAHLALSSDNRDSFVFGALVEGSLRLELDGEYSHQLVVGDAFSFSTRRQHQFSNQTVGPAKLVCFSLPRA